MKSKIDRKNRDRRGGHQSEFISSEKGVSSSTQVGRAFVKRQFKRMARRQHAKAFAEGMVHYHQDLEEKNALSIFDYSGYMDEDRFDPNDRYYQPEEPDYDDYVDDDYDGYFYEPDLDDWDPRPFYTDDDFKFDRPIVDVQPEFEVIRRQYVGKTLGQLLREASLRIEGGTARFIHSSY